MKKTEKQELTFTEAFEELSKIAVVLENNELPLESLSEKVARATFLAGLCKKKLREIETQIESVLEENSQEND